MEFTGSRYTGDFKNSRMEGRGEYRLPTNTRYEGEMKDSMFHGRGVLYFPNGSKYEGTWENGICKQGHFTFSDGLEYQETDWDYCDGNNRCFYSESGYGLKPAGESHLTNANPPPVIPDACCDCRDDPNIRVVSDLKAIFYEMLMTESMGGL